MRSVGAIRQFGQVAVRSVVQFQFGVLLPLVVQRYASVCLGPPVNKQIDCLLRAMMERAMVESIRSDARRQPWMARRLASGVVDPVVVFPWVLREL